MTMEREITMYARAQRGYRNWKKAMSKDGFIKHVGQTCSKHHSAALEVEKRRTARSDIAVALQKQLNRKLLFEGNNEKEPPKAKAIS
ncbi:hypothetical protein PI126_g18963 [Phytophthora idaei]|nr:hypothetical protein PI126_g18963 [Phytophthora idaei]